MLINKLHYIIVVSVIVIVFILPTCKKPEYIYLSETFKRYTVFPSGSYWVFENKNTGYIDTLFLTNNYIGLEKMNPGSNKEIEGGSIKYSSSSFGNYLGIISISGSDQDDAISKIVLISTVLHTSNIPDSIFSYEGLFFFCCKELGYSIGGAYYKDFSNNVVIGDNKFYNVMSIETNHDTLSPFFDEKMIKTASYAKGVGIISIEQCNGDVWEITDYHLNN